MTTVNTPPQPILDNIFALDLTTCGIEICLASTPNETPPVFRRLVLSSDAKDELRKTVFADFEQYRRENHKQHLTLHDFAVDVEIQAHEVEYLNLSGYENIKEQLAPLANFQSTATFEEEEKWFAEHLRFYVIIVQSPDGSHIYFFRHYDKSKLLSHSSFLGIRLNRDVYDRVRDPLFLFDRHIDCIAEGESLFIFHKNQFYDIFRFIEELEKTAKDILDVIEKKDLIYNFDKFKRDCLSDKNKLLKLKNISMQPYLDMITFEDIEKIIKQPQYNLNVPIVTTPEGKKKFQYVTGKNRWDLLNVLDDAHLSSPMTREEYLATGKRPFKKKK